uniref:Large ribosomal subunit protein bL32m n=1 Tax=Lynceus sp. MCZ IZ 141354 TaxID=1930659 RepID=A0A9N6WUL3_9CRUS|nr:EOG090X0IGM [Lynceus sp. MCZ IZ 141354]
MLSLTGFLRALTQSLDNIAAKLVHPRPNYAILGLDDGFFGNTKTESTEGNDEKSKGIMWAVPHCRRSVEKRLCRKFGAENWGTSKLIKPKLDLQVCMTCGHHHEYNRLCGHCYAQIDKETKLMQAEIDKNLGVSPIEKEVAVLYEGEKEQQSDDFFEGKHVIEMKKPRPSWFSQNLLQKTAPAAPAAVKPDKLG